MNIEHPMVTEINRYGYPLEYLKDEVEKEDENGSKQIDSVLHLVEYALRNGGRIDIVYHCKMKRQLFKT